MKKRKLKRKLLLNKRRITILNGRMMRFIKGGGIFKPKEFGIAAKTKNVGCATDTILP